jgi:3-deoxy-D-manno-octulosonic-acid transferase
MYALYTVLLGLAMLCVLPVVVWKRLVSGGSLSRAGARNAPGLAQRLGRMGPGIPPGPRCWIHAVSVGEVTTAIPLVEGIRRRWPQLGIVLTTVTSTGAKVALDRLGGQAVHRYFPLDLPGPVRRALDAIRPEFFLAMETEIWPNFFRALHGRAVPSMIVNGRLSDRSFRRYRLLRVLMRHVLSHVTVFAMQSAEDARRVIALGAHPERVLVTGNLKGDATAADGASELIWRRLLGLSEQEPVWIAGSTRRGEEEIVLDSFQTLRAQHPELRLILAPRHPERTPEIEGLLRDRRLNGARRTVLPRDTAGVEVILLDSVGELAQLYSLADVVFVGGSLVPWGGHNMLEPALRRKPVLFGPHYMNFRESAELLLSAGGAVKVADGGELTTAVGRLLRDPDLRTQMGEKGYAAVLSRRGAVNETLELIERFLIPPPRLEAL